MPNGQRARMLALLLLTGLALPLWLPAFAAPDREADKAASLARVNQWRAAIGVPSMTRHPALDRAAQSHADYNTRNPGHVHDETPGKPGFTGATMGDRTTAAGYPSPNVNENMGAYGDMLKSLDWFIGTVNHRLPLLDPRYVHVGFGIADRMEIINMGMPTYSETSDTPWEQWPPADARGIATSFAGEWPDPGLGRYPVGAPVTLKYLGKGGVTFTGGTITANGVQVPVIAKTGDGWITKHTYMVATTAPMQPATNYRVSITGAANGATFTRAWGFRTGAKGEPENVVAGSAGVGAVSVSVGTTAPVTATATVPVAATAAPAVPTAKPGAPAVPVATPTVAVPTAPAPTMTAAPRTATPTVRPVQKIIASRAMPVFPAAPAAPRGGYTLPRGIAAAPAVIGGTWGANDGAVASGGVARSWLFGPDAATTRTEAYAEATGGTRTVVYFDKARMEVGNGGNGGGGVTNGLLVVEMASGRVQIGDTSFRAAPPAAIPVAGDAARNAECPTYATLTALASYGGNGRRAPDRTGQPLTATLDAKGSVGDDPARAGVASAGWYEPTLGHNVPDVFMGWLGTLPERWQTLVGLPITEPYWTTTRVDGTLRPVLMQAFERRVLTYTPDNPAAWQIEMGNVGAHYLRWRDMQ